MGRAVMLAKTLATGVAQLLVVEAGQGEGPARPGGSAWMRQAWLEAGRPGEVLTLASGEAGAAGEGAKPCALAAILTLQPTGGLSPDLVRRIGALAADSAGAARWSGSALVMAFDAPRVAAEAALTLAAGLGEAARTGLAYDVVEPAADPFGGADLLLGPAVERSAAAAASAPPGAIHATGDFAAALHSGPQAGCPRTEYVGDLPGSALEDPVQLYALRRAAS